MSVNPTDTSEYVEAITATQPLVSSNDDNVDSARTPKNRKRTLSLPDNADTSYKKLRNDNEASSGRVLVQARRSLYGKTPGPKEQSNEERHGVPTRNTDTQGVNVLELLKNISGDIKSVQGRMADLEYSLTSKHKALSERFDQLEARLEKKLSEKVAQLIHKQFNSEVKRLRNEVEDKMGDYKAETTNDLSVINKNFEAFQESMAQKHSNGEDITLNIVIRDLPEHAGENVLVKVNNLIRDKLTLPDVVAHSAVRKTGSNFKPGVVVFTLESLDDKRRVMKAKGLLRNTNFSKVYIHHDQSRADRLMTANLRTIVDAVNSGNGSITVRGSRVVKKDVARGRQRSGSSGTNGSHGSESNRRERSVPGNDRTDKPQQKENDSGEYRGLFRNNHTNQGGARGAGRRYNRGQRRY